MNNLKVCFSELDELLKHISTDDWEKIPDNVLFYIRDNKNKDYIWQYDENKPIEEQNIRPETYFLLIYIMYKYVYTDEEKRQVASLITENTKRLHGQI